MSRPEPIFEAPWHAQLFALTVHLHERGVFDWPQWTKDFGATLAEHRLSGDLNGGDDYFNAWLATLEKVLVSNDMAPPASVASMRDAWEQAYLATPHGKPVRLGD
ncbi:nitrile hydratase accessory protein [uncultured Shimia sp.]|uniref:nitrile hydratase accessory protein n=1 Tax=uncultured Shimia sp. TaxID=573152 RepID=UPI00261FC5A8|nr:nitrile hydratase accessory protein [uncultured Shimia sp.]